MLHVFSTNLVKLVARKPKTTLIKGQSSTPLQLGVFGSRETISFSKGSDRAFPFGSKF